MYKFTAKDRPHPGPVYMGQKLSLVERLRPEVACTKRNCAVCRWFKSILSHNPSNEILSLITLHTRKTLKDGEAYKVIKGDDGPIAQKVLIDTAMAPAKTMGTHLEERTSHDENRMLKTQLRYDGACVWQNDSFLSVKLNDPRYEALLESKKDITQLGTGIYLEDTLSGAWIMPVDPKGREAHMKHLSEMRWALK